MVFGGRKTSGKNNNMQNTSRVGVPPGYLAADPYNARLFSKKNSPKTRNSLEGMTVPEGRLAVFFCEESETMFLDPTDDPIVLDFDDDLHCKTSPCGFRLASKSLGEHDQIDSHFHQKPATLKNRRAWSEGSLALVPNMVTTGCPCEAVQGIHSHQSCPGMQLTIPDTCCFTCGSDWALDHTAWACFECGGYGLTRPCGSCDGKCGVRWNRDLKMTHTRGEAAWQGKCTLDKENSKSHSDSELSCDKL